MQDIVAPAGFVPQMAIAYGADGSPAVSVDAANPLPVRPFLGVAPPPITGDASGSGVFGTFAAQPGRPVWLRLSGNWTGSVAVLRSTDGGITKSPLTLAGSSWAVFTGNVQEPVGEETEDGATYHLAVTLTSGAVSFRVSQ